MSPEEKKAIIAALVEKTGVKIDGDDPAFLLVHLNLLVLEGVIERIQGSTNELVELSNEASGKIVERIRELKPLLERQSNGLPPPSPTPASQNAPSGASGEPWDWKAFLIQTVPAVATISLFAVVVLGWAWYGVSTLTREKDELLGSIAKLELRAEAQKKSNKKAGICD